VRGPYCGGGGGQIRLGYTWTTIYRPSSNEKCWRHPQPTLLAGGDVMLQDAPETIERFLSGGESDLSTRRNAFLMLYNNAQVRGCAS
jgi:hypothetical protein